MIADVNFWNVCIGLDLRCMDDFSFSGTVSPAFDSSSHQQDTETASFPSKYNMLPTRSKDFLKLHVQYLLQDVLHL